MKILITGFSGFVAEYFIEYLNKVEVNCKVLGISRTAPKLNLDNFANLEVTVKQLDLLNKSEVENVIQDFKPEFVLHLASVSSVAQSWQTPYDSFVNNTNIFLNIVEQIRILKLPCRILSVGSSEEYGEVDEKHLPLREESEIKALSPYAVARISQEMLSKMYADGYNMDIIMTRSFNHIGARQKDKFVISSFAKQLVQLSKNQNSPKKITAGNLNIVRDFLDVRDVVKAYYLLLKKGKKGEVYNICSGKGTLLKDIVQKMSAVLDLEIEIELNPALVRPNENKKIIGSYEKINSHLGWAPNITIENSLENIIKYWQEELS
ncbi:MAG: GDP-mannose 4,6-dehydratase [Chitinophagaceae bacterium]